MRNSAASGGKPSMSTYVRMLGWLVALAEEIEAVFGLTPLPEPQQ